MIPPALVSQLVRPRHTKWPHIVTTDGFCLPQDVRGSTTLSWQGGPLARPRCIPPGCDGCQAPTPSSAMPSYRRWIPRRGNGPRAPANQGSVPAAPDTPMTNAFARPHHDQSACPCSLETWANPARVGCAKVDTNGLIGVHNVEQPQIVW